MGFLEIFKMILGGNPLDGIAKLIEEFHLSPEQKLAIQQAAAELQVKTVEIAAARDQALAEIQEKNLESARTMQTSVKSILPPLLSLVVTTGFFGLLYIIAFRSIPESSKAVLDIMVGVLGTAWIAIVNFYFGSSAGSEAKTSIIAGLSAKGGK